MNKEKLKKIGAIAAFPLVAVLGWVVVADRTAANGRAVHVVNGTPGPATLRLGSEELKVAPGQTGVIYVAEGAHEASVELAGEPAESVPFVLEGSALERFLDRSAFVINMGGRATLRWEEEEYGTRPSGRRRPTRMIFGDRFVALRDVDYAFEPFPEKIDSSDDVVTRTRLSVVMAEPAEIAAGFPGDAPRGLDYCELHLRPTAPDEQLLRVYTRLARGQKATGRLVAFLAKGLEPLWVPWHRAYQDANPNRSGVASEYAARLEASPDDSNLLYLCGRIAGAKSGRELYERAARQDPKNAFARHALAVRLARVGSYTEARAHSVAACELRPADPGMLALNHEIRFALGEYKPLETELRARRKAAPVDLATLKALLETLAAQGAFGRAREAVQAYRQEITSRLPGDPQQLATHAELLLLDLEGKNDEVVSLVQTLNSKRIGARLAFNACLDMGNIALAEKLLSDPPWSGVAGLLLGMAWERAGEPTKAKTWRERGRAVLAAGSPDEREAAKLLAQETVDPAAVVALSLSPAAKATVLAALGGACANEVTRFNTFLYFPHRFLSSK
jgi:hypothetical protein